MASEPSETLEDLDAQLDELEALIAGADPSTETGEPEPVEAATVTATAAEEAPEQEAALTGEALDDTLAAEASSSAPPPAEAPAPTADAGTVGESVAAEPAAEEEIEEFLAAAASEAPAKTAESTEPPLPPPPPEVVTAQPDVPPAEASEPAPDIPSLSSRIAMAALGILESVLARLDGPTARIRDDIKALVGYVAIVTLVMSAVTWAIALLQ